MRFAAGNVRHSVVRLAHRVQEVREVVANVIRRELVEDVEEDAIATRLFAIRQTYAPLVWHLVHVDEVCSTPDNTF